MIGPARRPLPPLGAVLHIGAGRGGDLGAYLRAGARAVTLVEPAPEAREALETAAADADIPVEPVAAAVSAADRPAPLRRFGFPGLASLRTPTGLRDLYPGLSDPEEIAVETRHPADLAAALLAAPDLPDQAVNLLVVEAPGEGQAVLAALDEADLLRRFAWIAVQDGAESLYEGQPPLEQTLRWLRDRDYEVALDAGSDPDRPHLQAFRDPRLAALRAERDAEKTRAETAETRLAAVQDERDSDRARAETAAAAAAQLQDELALGRAELQKAQAQLDLVCRLLLKGPVL